jgi:tyramine---L-glutamate ligase
VRIFLYEYLTGGGTLDGRLGGMPGGSLLAEGAAMVAALATDLAALPDTHVDLLRDARVTDQRLAPFPARTVHDAHDERDRFCELASTADAVIVIAPESEGILFDRCCWAEASGARMLSPSSKFIEIAADKHRTAAALQAAGLPVPQGWVVCPGGELPSEFPYPAVLKPQFGAGSLDTLYLENRQAASRYGRAKGTMRLERFHPGLPASVSVLCGPSRRLPLPACRQSISDDGRFRYLGGILPMSEAFCRRAQSLALQVLDALPATTGYVGVDLILGPDPSGCDDVVLEVNPRVTTSYVGLRRLCRGNLAAMMLAVSRGEKIEAAWSEDVVTFTSDGRTEIPGTIESKTVGQAGEADELAGGRYRRCESQVGG